MRTLRRLAPVALALAMALALAACAGNPQKGDVHMLSVTGSGSARLAPDMVLVTLGVHTQGPDIGAAVQENNLRATQVMTAITEAGVAKPDVRTTYFNVSTQPVFDDKGTPTGAVTYMVDNTVTVTLRQIDKLGSLLQAALSKGANNVQGVSYTVEDPSKALADARSKAMQDARHQAEEMATAAGVQLGEVISIGEGGVVPGPTFYAPAYGKGGGGGGPVPTSPGTLEYQVQVSVMYALR